MKKIEIAARKATATAILTLSLYSISLPVFLFRWPECEWRRRARVQRGGELEEEVMGGLCGGLDPSGLGRNLSAPTQLIPVQNPIRPNVGSILKSLVYGDPKGFLSSLTNVYNFL